MSKPKFNASMFEKIKDALNKSSEGNKSNAYANVMKFPAGKTYTLRLIPNLDNPGEKTFFHHYTHGWKSKTTGSYISTLSLQTFGERDPITETFWKFIKSADPAEKALGKLLSRKENWFVNVYVIDDPSTPENNGTVKILRVGPQIKKIIDDALTGDGADEFGIRIFDLGPEGANLKIKAETSGDYTTFASSGFYNKPTLNLSDDEIEKIYESVHDLEQIHPVKTFDELQEILDIHFYGKTPEVAANKPAATPKSSGAASSAKSDDSDDLTDDIPFDFDTKSNKKETPTSDDEIDRLLGELNED
jgi:hypothetical protein